MQYVLPFWWISLKSQYYQRCLVSQQSDCFNHGSQIHVKFDRHSTMCIRMYLANPTDLCRLLFVRSFDICRIWKQRPRGTTRYCHLLWTSFHSRKTFDASSKFQSTIRNLWWLWLLLTSFYVLEEWIYHWLSEYTKDAMYIQWVSIKNGDKSKYFE